MKVLMAFCLQEEAVVAVVVEMIWNPCHRLQVEAVVGVGAAVVRW